MDSEGKFLSASLYNIDSSVLNEKLKKDSLLTIIDPFVKRIEFEGFCYDAVEVFEITKLWVDKSKLTSKEFNPNVVFSETFEKWFLVWMIKLII